MSDSDNLLSKNHKRTIGDASDNKRPGLAGRIKKEIRTIVDYYDEHPLIIGPIR